MNNFYIEEGKLTYEILDGWWTDAGTFESLLRANDLVAKTGANKMTQRPRGGNRRVPGSDPMKIFVTGGAGFIGSNFIRHVLSLNKGYQVVNYDKLTYAGNLANLESVADNPNYSFVRGDICDAAALEEAMNGCTAVVHFAAESHVDRSIYEPAPVIETNVTGTFFMLQVARKLRVERFVHISTDEVYGDMLPGAFADGGIAAAAEQPVFRVQGRLRPVGSLLRAHVRISRADHALFEQLRPVPVSGKISPVDDHQRARRQAAADLRRRKTAARLAARGRQLPRGSGGPRAGHESARFIISAASDVEENLTIVRNVLSLHRQAGVFAFLCERPSRARPPLRASLR